MALKDITDPDAVLRAIAEFDEQGREAFLKRYKFGKASKYFVRTGDGWYDTKAIAGVAHKHQHGWPLRSDEFSGGEVTVVAQLKGLGFSVVKAGPQPDWTTDELMLALKLYLESRNSKGGYTKKTAEINQLSQELRTLPIFSQEVRDNPGFRTPGAVSLKMENFAFLDPQVSSNGKDHIGAADRRIWGEWGHRYGDLTEAVLKIRDLLSRSDVAAETGEDEEFSASEGRILYREHRRYERNRQLVDKKRKQALKQSGRLACEVCGFDSKVTFGIEGVIDVHHVVPLHKIGESTTNLKDLALLCPTCHRTVHKHTPFLTLKQLADLRNGHKPQAE